MFNVQISQATSPVTASPAPEGPSGSKEKKRSRSGRFRSALLYLFEPPHFQLLALSMGLFDVRFNTWFVIY